eukprot:3356536-Ditylum_brightwellii.AAC.1
MGGGGCNVTLYVLVGVLRSCYWCRHGWGENAERIILSSYVRFLRLSLCAWHPPPSLQPSRSGHQQVDGGQHPQHGNETQELPTSLVD